MVLELYIPTKEDIPEIVALGYDGYSDNLITPLMYPVPASEQLLSNSVQGMLADYGKNPHYTHLAVKDTETGKLASWMEWYVVPEATDENWNVYVPRTCPPGWNKDFFDHATKLAWQSKIDAMGKQAYIYFQTLVTTPAFRKRGAGSILMKALLDFQAQVNLPIYLVASPSGYPLYIKFGFKEVLRYELDISALKTTERRFQWGMILSAPEPDKPARIPQALSSVDASDVEIKPLTTLAEHIAMREIRERAFGPDEVMLLAFGGQANEGTEESRAARSFEDAERDPRHKWLGAFDKATGTLIGVAHWYFVDDPTTEHFPHGNQGWMPGTNVALAERHFGPMQANRTKYMKGKKYAYMCLLIVDVTAQRRGVGTKLLKHTLREIDELGWESWIEATPAGIELYLRLGWQVVEWIKTDLKEFGGQSIAEDACLIRPSKSA